MACFARRTRGLAAVLALAGLLEACAGGGAAPAASTLAVATATPPSSIGSVATATPAPSGSAQPSRTPVAGTESARYLTPRPAGSTGFKLGYYEYLPPSYSPSGARSPLLVATNGSGENGDGTEAMLPGLLNGGIPGLIDNGAWPTERPFVVLAPQHYEAPGFPYGRCAGKPWDGSCNMQIQHDAKHASPAFCTTPDEIHDLIAYAVAHYNVDPKRTYVTGLSCGGFGVWEYVAKYGNSQVAAAVPIAGDGRLAWATAGCRLGSVAIWAFHGAADDLVDPRGSSEPIAKIAACPGVSANRARVTVYADLPHGGWDEAYTGSRGEDIYSWMLSFAN